MKTWFDMSIRIWWLLQGIILLVFGFFVWTPISVTGILVIICDCLYDNRNHKVLFGLGAVIELLLWSFAITDWEDTPWYSCISSLSGAMWINYLVALGLFVYLWKKGDKR